MDFLLDVMRAGPGKSNNTVKNPVLWTVLRIRISFNADPDPDPGFFDSLNRGKFLLKLSSKIYLNLFTFFHF